MKEAQFDVFLILRLQMNMTVAIENTLRCRNVFYQVLFCVWYYSPEEDLNFNAFLEDLINLL